MSWKGLISEYREYLPITENTPALTLLEGNTPLIKCENLSKDLGVELFVKSVDTVRYAKENSISIEMAARDLRYAWFHSLRNEKGFDYIALGHIHKRYINENLAYPGSCIALGFDELGEHGMLDVALEKNETKIEFIMILTNC